MKVNFLKKRQVFLALFLFLFLFLISAEAFSACKAIGELEKAEIERIVDGDTLHLKDGRKVRLVGINTPELDHQHGNHQAYAVKATQFLTSLLGKYVYLQPAKSDRDRYGRYLYYLFDENYDSLTGQLLAEGLGYRIAIPPNLAYQDCFAKAENTARFTGLNLWADPSLVWQEEGGFTLSEVTISAVTQNRRGWWLETTDRLVINLPPSDLDIWPAQVIFQLENKHLEVRGWQHFRKNRNADFKPWVLIVRHPRDLRLID